MYIYIYWECVKVYIEYTRTRFCLRGFYSTEYCAILHNTAHLLYPWCLWSTSFHPQSGHTLRFWLWMDRINGWCDVWGAVPKCGKHQKLFDMLHDSVNICICVYIYIYYIYCIYIYILYIYNYEIYNDIYVWTNKFRMQIELDCNSKRGCVTLDNQTKL